jgi:hypothetical protein
MMIGFCAAISATVGVALRGRPSFILRILRERGGHGGPPLQLRP